MDPLDRRQFVAAGLAACACAACPALRALAEAKASRAAVPVEVGCLDDFRDKGIYVPRQAGGRFFLVNRRGRLYAISATCTHRAVKLVTKDGGFKCPRHGSTFSAEGRVGKSPAQKSLPRFGIFLDDQGRVVVDPSSVFAAGRWDDAQSFIPLE